MSARQSVTDVVVLLAQLAQQASVDPFSPLLQVGVTGAVLVIALLALRAVYQQQVATLTATVAAERARADRSDEELAALNKAVRETLMGTMAQFAEASRESLRALERRP